MKEAISTTWIVGLMTTFIFLFSGYLAVTISYSRAFKIKDEVLYIIEKHHGMTSDTRYLGYERSVMTSEKVYTHVPALQTISAYLYGSGYNTKSTCPSSKGWYGVYDLGIPGSSIPKPKYENSDQTSKKAFFCFITYVFH